MKFVFFSMRNFTRDGGGSIRMYGILNTLSEKGHEVVFVSNAQVLDKFHENITHLAIDCEMTSRQKAIFQGLLGLLPATLVYGLFKSVFNKIVKAFKEEITADNIFFCEYLDNSIGYVLKKKGFIENYAIDIHGIAPMEFQYQKELAKNWQKKLFFATKFEIANSLDRKVMGAAFSLIYASKQMHQYFIAKYPELQQNKAIILPYVLGKDASERAVNYDLKDHLMQKYGLASDDFVFFFAGGYKPTAGIEDLINRFSKLWENYQNEKIKLFLIGNGPTFAKCLKLAEESKAFEDIIFVEKVPYNELKTYQDLAKVIVNPDRQNDYSDLIVHLKYFDALASGKLVINSRFKSVMEINVDDKLSLTFSPSNMEELYKVMEDVLLNFDKLQTKYASTQLFTSQNLTYHSLIDSLVN